MNQEGFFCRLRLSNIFLRNATFAFEIHTKLSFSLNNFLIWRFFWHLKQLTCYIKGFSMAKTYCEVWFNYFMQRNLRQLLISYFLQIKFFIPIFHF